MKSQCHYSVESHKTCFVEDDDEVHDDNNESFWQNGCPTKGDKPYLQPPPLLEVLIIRNHPHTASRILTCGEPKFKLCPTKLCSSDNHYKTRSHTAKSFYGNSDNTSWCHDANSFCGNLDSITRP